ncbi:unnamed protein product [Effrenium voratum]|nr:unnamed protein product [Effrenium voratum]CAJ1422248.1 unnamed protein product [Effrenium voratum]
MASMNRAILGRFGVAGHDFAVVLNHVSVEVEVWPADLPLDATLFQSPARLRSSSAPAVKRWTEPWDEASLPVSVLEHQAGQCRPCYFFRAKKDGCRKGAQCERCHLCTLPEMKRRRNQELRERRGGSAKAVCPKPSV